MYASSMSPTVESCGMLTVLEIAPERNGWTAPIIVMWPAGLIARSPTATSKTGRSASRSPGAPTIVLCSLMCATICSTCSSA